MIHRLNGELGHLAALVHGHGEKLAGAALHQDAVNPLLDQVFKQFALALQIQAAILMEQGDGGGQISRFHIRFSFRRSE